MTSPETDLRDCPGVLSWCFTPGFPYHGVDQLTDLSGNPIDWPVGTQARARISWGTGSELVVAAVVSGGTITVDLTAEQTAGLPRGSRMVIDTAPAGDPPVWKPWRSGRAGRCR